jgi:hypothetical protein
MSFRQNLSPPRFANPVLGHVVLCIDSALWIRARFGCVYLCVSCATRDFSIPTGRYVITALGLFSTFCFTRELERLGRALLGSEAKDE